MGKNLYQFCQLALVLTIIWGCTTTSSDNSQYDSTHGTAISWHRGTLEQAFAVAKQKQQPLLLYWGATWCPPCNELKAEVFSKPEFKELMQGTVPVYLDGDSEYAQTWGELFQISGYPTILVLDHEKRELMRIHEALSMAEFQTAYRSAIQKSRPFLLTLEQALNGKATNADWRTLAYFAWYGARGLDVHDSNTLKKRQTLAEKVPEKLVREKALLSARLLESAASKSSPAGKVRDNIKRQAGKYIAAMIVDQEARFAARSTLLSSHNSVLNWAYSNDAVNRKLMSDKWVDAVTRLRSDKRLSNDQKLWTWFPAIQAAKNQPGPDGKVPAALRANVEAAVVAANNGAKSAFERQAVVSGAAYLLRKIGSYDKAAALLLAEVKVSKSPFYYYSSLANLEKERGDNEQALEYAEQASKYAQGRATRLQWLVTDMRMTSQLAEKDKQDRIEDLAEEFYDLLFAVKDGFAGRSFRSTKRLSDILGEMDLSASLKSDLRAYSRRCGRLKDTAKLRCQAHFSKILKSS